jgi:hypothetical protein
MNDSDKFSNMSDDKLAEVQDGLLGNPRENILIENEWRRRERIEQHKLDLDLVAKQVRWMKFSVFAGIISALLGVILGWFLQRHWPASQPQNAKSPIQSRTSSSTAVDRKETNVAIPFKAPPVENPSNHPASANR